MKGLITGYQSRCTPPLVFRQIMITRREVRDPNAARQGMALPTRQACQPGLRQRRGAERSHIACDTFKVIDSVTNRNFV